MASRFNIMNDDNVYDMVPSRQGGYYDLVPPRPAQVAVHAMQPEQGPLHAEHMSYTRLTFNSQGAMTEAVHSRGKAQDVQGTLSLCGHTEQQVATTIVKLNAELEGQKALVEAERHAHEATKAELVALKADYSDLNRKFTIADGALVELANKSPDIHAYLVNRGIFPAPGPNFVHPSMMPFNVQPGVINATVVAAQPSSAAVAAAAPAPSAAQKRAREEVDQASDIIQRMRTRRGGGA